MSKAEDRANEKYPAWKNGIGDEFNVNSAYYGFIEGYHQAEKDLELTWKDIEKVCLIAREVHQFRGFWSESVYQEVLKRFKEKKE